MIVAGLAAAAVFGLLRGAGGSACRVGLEIDPRVVQNARNAARGVSGQAAAESYVEGALKTLGAGEVFLVTQDPTSERVWSAIVSKRPQSGGAIRVTGSEAVDRPAPPPRPFRDPSFDHGLTKDDAAAVGRALSTESDPKRLEGLARSFDVDFPVAASVLRCKSRLETLARMQNVHAKEAREKGTPLPIGAKMIAGRLARAARAVGAPGGFASYEPVLASMPAVFPDTRDKHGKRDAIGRMLTGQIRDSVEVQDGFAFGCAQLSARPELCKVPPSVLSSATKIGEASAALALAAARPEGPGLCLIDAETARRVLPGGPRPVSKGALQMAHAMMRPEGSLVDSPRTLSAELGAMQRAAQRGDPMAMRAQAEVGRARRLLDRQNWIGWYKRQEAAERRG